MKVNTEAVAEGVPATTSAEGKLHRLVNRSAGWLNIGPFLKLFSRYDRLSLTFFVAPPFQFRGPAGPFDDPSMAMTLETGGNAGKGRRMELTRYCAALAARVSGGRRHHWQARDAGVALGMDPLGPAPVVEFLVYACRAAVAHDAPPPDSREEACGALDA